MKRIWFDKMCRVVGKGMRFVDPIYDDYLYRYDTKAGKWKKRWFLLDDIDKSLYQFKDMEQCDEFCKHAYGEDKEYKKAFKRYVEDHFVLQPFDSKNIQKIRPGSNLQKKLIKECIFIIHNKTLGKLFFATEQQNQLNRWFKKIRSLAGDAGVRKKSKSHVSAMSEGDLNVTERKKSKSQLSQDSDIVSTPGSHISTKAGKGQNKILQMLQELDKDFGEMKEDIRFIKTQWEENNASADSKGDESSDEY